MAVIPSGGRAQVVTTTAPPVDAAAQARDLQEALAGDYLSDPMHVMEDVAWQGLTQDPYAYQSGLDFAPQARQLQVQRARYTWRSYPLAKQGIRLYVNACLGQGMAFHAEQDAVQQLLQDFWDDPLNRRGFTSMVSQKRALIRRQVDGELFLFLFTDPETGQVRVRVGEPLEISDVVTDPDDAERPLYYERRHQPRTFQYSSAPGAGGTHVPAGGSTGTAQILYYADAFNADLPNPPPALEQARVLHAKINDLGARGVSDLYAALDWLTSHKTFMEDRATLTHALAKVAWTKKVTGGPSAVAASAALERSTLSSLGATPYLGYEANPPAITGSTFVSNDGVTLAPVKVDTAAGNAETDGRMLTIQIGAALGIMIHYFGDGGDANLATATAMNEPMRQLFLDGQEGWGDLLTSLFSYVILQAIKAGTLDGTVDDRDGVEVPLIGGAPPVVTVEFPPIVREETLPTVQALDLARKDGLVSEEFAARKALNVLGADDIDDEVKKALSDGPLVPPTPPLAPGQGPGNGAPGGRRVQESGAPAEKDFPADGRWVTINGTHVYIDRDGYIVSGPRQMRGTHVSDHMEAGHAVTYHPPGHDPRKKKDVPAATGRRPKSALPEKTLDEIVAHAQDAHQQGRALYIRYSRGAESDAKGGYRSKNHATGQQEAGLSVNNLTSEYLPNERQHIAQRLYEYSYMMHQGVPGTHAWVLEGREVGRGADNEPLVADVTPIGKVSDAALDEAEEIWREADRKAQARAKLEHKYGSAWWRTKASPEELKDAGID